MRFSHKHIAIATAMILCFACQGVQAGLIEDFDDNSDTPFALTNTSGGAPAVLTGGGTNQFVRLTNLNDSNNNSIAWDEKAGATGPAPLGLQIAFDFRMTDDAANAAAGGCCGSAADGMGIGLFLTSTYGTSGSINPGDGGPAWERPNFVDAFAIGLDIFQNIDEVNLNFGGVEVANMDVQPIMDLNNNIWHRAVVNVTPSGGDAMVNMIILEDVDGLTQVHSIFADQVIPGLDLTTLPGYRLIAGGRTGGAFVAGDLDNIAVSITVPEPTAITLLVMTSLALWVLRRR